MLFPAHRAGARVAHQSAAIGLGHWLPVAHIRTHQHGGANKEAQKTCRYDNKKQEAKSGGQQPGGKFFKPVIHTGSIAPLGALRKDVTPA